MTIERRHEPVPGAVPPSLRGWLESVVERGASDLLLVADARPALKINGAVTPLAEAALLTGDDISAAVARPPRVCRGGDRGRLAAASGSRALSNQPAPRARTRGRGDSTVAADGA